MKSRQGRRPYRVETLAAKQRVSKSGSKKLPHAEKRLLERTSLDPAILVRLRKRLKGSSLPAGDHHVAVGSDSVVLKEISTRAGKKHVVASVYSGRMRPPGRDVGSLLKAASALAFIMEKVAKRNALPPCKRCGNTTRDQRGGICGKCVFPAKEKEAGGYEPSNAQTAKALISRYLDREKKQAYEMTNDPSEPTSPEHMNKRYRKQLLAYYSRQSSPGAQRKAMQLAEAGRKGILADSTPFADLAVGRRPAMKRR